MQKKVANQKKKKKKKKTLNPNFLVINTNGLSLCVK
jgi:hypothetical protein